MKRKFKKESGLVENKEAHRGNLFSNVIVSGVIALIVSLLTSYYGYSLSRKELNLDRRLKTIKEVNELRETLMSYNTRPDYVYTPTLKDSTRSSSALRIPIKYHDSLKAKWNVSIAESSACFPQAIVMQMTEISNILIQGHQSIAYGSRENFDEEGNYIRTDSKDDRINMHVKLQTNEKGGEKYVGPIERVEFTRYNKKTGKDEPAKDIGMRVVSIDYSVAQTHSLRIMMDHLIQMMAKESQKATDNKWF